MIIPNSRERSQLNSTSKYVDTRVIRQVRLSKKIVPIIVRTTEEVCNRVIWDSLFTCNFSIYKKDTCKLSNFTQTPKYLYDPHSYQKNNHIKKHTHKTQTFSITPFHTKKTIIFKKGTYKSENTYITPFIVIIF